MVARAVGLGAGGHAKIVIEILRAAAAAEPVSLLDPREELWGTELLGVPVLGGDDLLPRLREDGVTHAFVGVGGVDDPAARRRLYELARAAGLAAVVAIHPSAVVSPSAELGDGPTVAAGAVVNAATRVEDNVLVGTGAIVEHDCRIGSHAHVATGARLAGGVEVGVGAWVGAGATVIQGLRIGAGAMVGAGAVVIAHVAAGTTVAGVPARPIGART